MQSKIVARVVVIGLISINCVLADSNKGQKRYIKACKECHGDGAKGAAMKTQDEWEALFSNEGEGIIEIHDKSGAKSFFHSPKFQKYSPHLKDFLYEYGSDSGNIPVC